MSGRSREIRSHFGITVGGVPIAYCYIRKNACSAWKRLFVEESPFAAERARYRREIAFMAARHGLRSIADIERYDRRVAVVRDPVERYVSAFVSLLVAGTPPPTRQLRNLGRRLIGREVEDVSFDMMLEHLLPNGGDRRRRRIEKHFWPQVWHLAPLRYTDVIDIDRLAATMKAMIGDTLGARYFDRPVNATAVMPAYEDPDAGGMPASELAARYRNTGALPAKASFLRDGRADVIRAAYAEDAALYDACRAHDRSVTGQSMDFRVEPPPARSWRPEGDRRARSKRRKKGATPSR
jgi:hypothetical protein